MSIYRALIVAFGVWTPENIVNSFHSATALAFTFDSVEGATGYEYTTDGGITHRTIVSGVNFTTDSAGNPLQANTHYSVQIRSVDSDVDDFSLWSEIVDGFTSSAMPPVVRTLPYIVSGEGVYLRAGIIDDGGAACKVRFEIDSVYTDWIDNRHTGDIVKQFRSIDFSSSHQYRAVIENIADTTYGNYVTIPPIVQVEYKIEAYKYV